MTIETMKNNDFEVILTLEEKEKCLKEIIKKNRRILYVYEQSQLPDSEYNYKVYVHGLVLYVTTSNNLFKGELVNIVVNLCSILQNELDHAEIKKLVFENTNFATYLLKKVGDELGSNQHD